MSSTISVMAQVPPLPPPNSQDRDPLPTPRPIPQPIPDIPIEQPPSPPVTPPPSLPPGEEIPDTLTIEQFQFEGNTAFTDAELTNVIEAYINRPITFAELLQAEAVITQYYIDAGYVNSGALLPANQNLSDGIVTLRIVEGGVEEINISGNGRLNADYIRSRIARKAKTPFNVNQLIEALQLLQLNPLIDQISAELAAGTRPEQSSLNVTVTVADTFSVDLFLDNGRTPSVGSFRRGVTITEANLLGFGDQISATYANTDGSNRYDANYTFPYNATNGTIRFDFYGNDSDVIEEPFDRLDITGESQQYSLTIRQPIYQTPRQDLALGVILSHENSQTTILGEEEPLSVGADENGKTSISAVRFFQDYLRRDAQSVFAVRSQFSIGLDVFDATNNFEAPDGQFVAWRGQGQYVRLLAPETLLVIRSDIQFASRPLLALEQFALGGYQSVRGYRQDLLLSDNGVLLSAEALFPITEIGDNGVLQVYPFLDFGTAWNSGDRQDPIDSTLLGTGIGLQLRLGETLTGRIEYGIPLIDVETRDKGTLQEDGLYFSLIVTPF
ncbi:MAG: ShlB/FhaC/HecB family hemolysin secretion/activation protein [Microcoleaceae cyanobacterium]